MSTTTPMPSTDAGRPPDWGELVRGVLAEPDRLVLVFQPIVGLQEGVIVGYEALSRFTGPPGLTPDLWFAAADELGLGAELEALVIARCLQLRPDIPPDCFLTVNVSPHLITEPVITDLLLAAGDLRPIVLELTEHQQAADLRPLIALRDTLSARGVLLALDDAGAGYSGLQQMTRLRPNLIKLDRALVSDADTDEVKLALAELLGEFAGRIDAWLLAEGVETWAELEAFLRIGVPLAQGFLLGRPAPPWARLDPATTARLRVAAARSRLIEHVASLVEVVPVEGREPLQPERVAMRVDGLGRPVAVLVPRRRQEDGPGHRVAPVSLRVPSSADVIDVARRVVARPQHLRFDPVVCVDEQGRGVGVIRMERLILRLAELKSTR